MALQAINIGDLAMAGLENTSLKFLYIVNMIIQFKFTTVATVLQSSIPVKAIDAVQSNSFCQHGLGSHLYCLLFYSTLKLAGKERPIVL